MSRRPIGSASCLALLASLAFTLIHAADAAKWLTRRGRTFAHWALVPVSIRRTPEKPTPHLPEDPLLRKRQRQQLPGSERWAHSVSQSVSEPTCWTGQEPPSTLYPQTPNTPPRSSISSPNPIRTTSEARPAEHVLILSQREREEGGGRKRKRDSFGCLGLLCSRPDLWTCISSRPPHVTRRTGPGTFQQLQHRGQRLVVHLVHRPHYTHIHVQTHMDIIYTTCTQPYSFAPHFKAMSKENIQIHTLAHTHVPTCMWEGYVNN